MTGKLQGTLVTAGIGAIGGLVAVLLGHVMGLSAERQELLEQARRDAYVEWAEVRELHTLVDHLRAVGKSAPADSVMTLFNVGAQKVGNRIAIYGEKQVVEALSAYFSQIYSATPACPESWQKDVAIYRGMRHSLLGTREAVNDSILAFLVLRCVAPSTSIRPTSP